MAGAPRKTVEWVAQHILPYEPQVRCWLLRGGMCIADADDLIHDAYCRLSELRDVSQIANPRGYFLTIVRNLRREQFRRQKVVRFEALTEIAASSIIDEAENPERAVAARQQLALVTTLLDELPARCREIFRLRRVEGVSQRDIARKLGVTEGVVENDAARALRHILAALRHRAELVEDGEPLRHRA